MIAGRRADILSSVEREELRRENRQLRRERDILAKAAARFAQSDATSSSGLVPFGPSIILRVLGSMPADRLRLPHQVLVLVMRRPYTAVMCSAPKFDVALSFAGEDRKYVDRVAHELCNRGIKVFYDLFEEADLWGKDLYSHYSDVYQKQARFTVMFISESYGKKLWTDHERRAAQARAFQDPEEYILPARFDETEIPGVLPPVGYISLKNRTPEEFVEC